MAISARISKSGQVTIPAEIREKLGVKPGDSILWQVDDHGMIAVIPVKYTFDELCGIVPRLKDNKALLTVIDEALEEWGESKVREFEDVGK